MSTVSHGRSGLLRWPQWIMAESVYLTSVGHGRTCVPGCPLVGWAKRLEITARQHTSTQLCAGTGQVSSFSRHQYCGSWQDLCTGMATMGHGRTCVPTQLR
ncbi:hypothetical protein J6590_098582 [Homalodisca vitripennis]|nr:hypothetical protein J6590_098582 [Homalodisca vitripennis]